jgi:general stress protein 26
MLANTPKEVGGQSGTRVDQLLVAARQTMAKVTDCWAATPSGDGAINVRVVAPLPRAEGDEDWTLWIATGRSSRKAADIRPAGRITLGYQHHPDRAYVALIGRAALVEDRLEIRRRWTEAWRLYFPRGPDSPETILVRVDVDRIELCVRGVTPEPFGSRYSAIERDRDLQWRLVSD